MSRSALRIFSAMLACAGLLAQDQQAPTFRTSTNLVIINVAVKDKSGKAIEDLKKNQFTLLEDGKPQQISVFELEHLNGATLPPLEVPAPTLKTRGPVESKPTPPAEAPPVNPILKSDQLKDRRLIAMFFDLSSMQPAEQIRARDAANKVHRHANDRVRHRVHHDADQRTARGAGLHQRSRDAARPPFKRCASAIRANWPPWPPPAPMPPTIAASSPPTTPSSTSSIPIAS